MQVRYHSLEAASDFHVIRKIWPTQGPNEITTLLPSQKCRTRLSLTCCLSGFQQLSYIIKLKATKVKLHLYDCVICVIFHIHMELTASNSRLPLNENQTSISFLCWEDARISLIYTNLALCASLHSHD